MNKNCWESSPKIKRADKFTDLDTQGFLNDKSIQISLNKKGLMWKDNESGGVNVIKYQQIVNVKRQKNKPAICINYLNPTHNLNVKFETSKFKLMSIEESEKWSKTIIKKIKNSFNRLKNLVIFIDKTANRCKIDGKTLFDDQIKHVLDEARISYALKEIESPKEIANVVEYLDTISSSNGIIIISGDETASAIISNVINSFQVDKGPLKQVPIPFGIIPIGNHNDIARSIWGNEDVENALLNILLCNSFQTDILSISSKESRNKTWGFNFHYGLYNIFEKYRVENSTRKGSAKDIDIMKKAIKNSRVVECDVKYKASSSAGGLPTNRDKCHINCSECNMKKFTVTKVPTYNLNSSMKSDTTDDESFESTSNQNFEAYRWIIINCIPCLPELAPEGFTPACHFNDNSADLVLVKSKHKKDLKKFVRYLDSNLYHLLLPFVNSVRIEEVNISLNPNSLWVTQNESVTIGSIMANQEEDIIIDEDLSTNSTEEDEQSSQENHAQVNQKDYKSNNSPKQSKKLLKPIVKACKELLKTTGGPSTDENYRKPNMLESEKERERKAEKQRKKAEKLENQKPIWMLDYNFLKDFNPFINIKVHSGLVSFFGRACDDFHL